MDKNLKEYIINKKHHALRRNVDRDLATEFSLRGLSPAQRMMNVSNLCASKNDRLFLKTNVLPFCVQ